MSVATAYGTTNKGKTALYEINPETGTCKKISRATEKFSLPTDWDSITAESAVINTKCLHDFLKEKELPVTYCGSRADRKVACYGYEFQYLPGEFGFEVRDSFRAFTRINESEWSDELPTPEAVYRWLTKNQNRPAVGDTPVVLTPNQRLERVGETITVVERAPQKPRETMEDCLDRVFKSIRNKEATLKEGNAMLQKVISNPSHKNKVGRAFKTTANVNLLEKEVREIIATIAKVKAPKFEAYDFPEVFVNIKEEGDNVTYTYLTGEKAGDTRTRTMAKHSFYWRYCLHLYPQAMVALTRIAQGDVENIPENYHIKDAYTAFNKHQLDATPLTEHLIDACEDILSYLEEFNPLDWVYSTDYKVGDKVKVYWPDFATYFNGEVINTSTGILIRYEDGEAVYLRKTNKVKKLA